MVGSAGGSWPVAMWSDIGLLNGAEVEEHKGAVPPGLCPSLIRWLG